MLSLVRLFPSAQRVLRLSGCVGLLLLQTCKPHERACSELTQVTRQFPEKWAPLEGPIKDWPALELAADVKRIADLEAKLWALDAVSGHPELKLTRAELQQVLGAIRIATQDIQADLPEHGRQLARLKDRAIPELQLSLVRVKLEQVEAKLLARRAEMGVERDRLKATSERVALACSAE